MNFGLKALLTLAWPVILARAAQAVVGFSDALMTAPLGKDALAATTTGSINVFTVTILPIGVAFIVQTFASQYTGKGDHRAATRYAWYGMGLAVFAQALALVTLPAVDSVFGALSYEPQVRALMTPYFQIRLLAVGAIVGVEVFGNWYGGRGDTQLHMRAGILAMCLNVFLNWVLIYGNLGAPPLGVEGAAIASALSSVAACVYVAASFFRDPQIPTSPRGLGLCWEEVRRFIRFGLPHGINWFLEFGAVAVFINVVVADMGTAALAALMVVFNVNSVSFMPGFGLSSAGAILVGQAIGAKKPDLVPRIVLRTAVTVISWQCIVGLVYLLFPEQLMTLFAQEGAVSKGELVAVGTTMLMMSAGWQFFDALHLSVGEALRGAGDTSWTMWARIATAWLFFFPLSYFVLNETPEQAMLSLILYLAALSIVLTGRFLTGRWRSIRVTDAT